MAALGRCPGPCFLFVAQKGSEKSDRGFAAFFLTVASLYFHGKKTAVRAKQLKFSDFLPNKYTNDKDERKIIHMQVSGIQSDNSYGRQVQNKQQAEDSVIKNAQSQIEALRKQLRQLAENEEMDPKTKAQKKQDIQKQIAELNAQIRQRQAEIRKEKQEAREPSQREIEKKAEENAKTEGTSFSKTEAGSIISASNALDAAQDLSGLNKKLSGRARELGAEIKTDLARGADTKAKENELSKVKKGIKHTAEGSAEILNEAGKELETAAKIDVRTEEKKAEKEAKNGENEDEVKTDGMYDKDGNRVEDRKEKEYEDKA